MTALAVIGLYTFGLLGAVAAESRRYNGDTDAWGRAFADSPVPGLRVLFWPLVLVYHLGLSWPIRLAWRLGAPKPPPKIVDVSYREPRLAE